MFKSENVTLFTYIPNGSQLYDTRISHMIRTRLGIYFLLIAYWPFFVPLAFFAYKLFLPAKKMLFKLINPVVRFEVIERKGCWFEVMWIFRNGRKQFHAPGFVSEEEARTYAEKRIRSW